MPGFGVYRGLKSIRGDLVMSEQISAVGSDRFATGPGGVLVEMLEILQAMRAKDFSVRMRNDWDGLACKIADTINDSGGAGGRGAARRRRGGRGGGEQGRTN